MLRTDIEEEIIWKPVSTYLLIFFFLFCFCLWQSKDLQLDIIPATAPGSEVKLRDAAHELNEEKRKSARRKEYVAICVMLDPL